MCVLLITRLLRLMGWALVNWSYLTSGVAIFTQTDRPKSVRNLLVVGILVTCFVLSRLFLYYFFEWRGFCYKTESNLFLFSCIFIYIKSTLLQIYGPVAFIEDNKESQLQGQKRRSDSVLWQKPLHPQKCQKGKLTTQTTPQKSSIKHVEWLRTVSWSISIT